LLSDTLPLASGCFRIASGSRRDERNAEGTEPPEAVLALRLLLFTGCRKNEILKLRWRDVDLERRLLLLPDSKTGAKAVPLGAPAVELLAAAPRIAGSPYVIPGKISGKHFVGLPKVWERLRSVAGLEDVRLHDLRHSFASIGAGGGLSLPILGKLLGHSQPATTARYAHLAADPVRKAVEQVSGEMAAALAGKGGGTVVNLEERLARRR
jgi:integrase